MNLLETKSGNDYFYIPEEGHIVLFCFDPQAGREQSGVRPAFVISPIAFNNSRTKFALVCPITTKVKGYPFEVELLPGGKTEGVILVDQIKSLDWSERNIKFIEKSPPDVINKVYIKLSLILPRFKLII